MARKKSEGAMMRRQAAAGPTSTGACKKRFQMIWNLSNYSTSACLIQNGRRLRQESQPGAKCEGDTTKKVAEACLARLVRRPCFWLWKYDGTWKGTASPHHRHCSEPWPAALKTCLTTTQALHAPGPVCTASIA